MIITGGESAGDGKTSTEPPRAPSPPPAYSAAGSSNLISESAPNATDPGAIQIIVQHPSSELPSAFRPPSPSSFPHPHPHTRFTSSGPTPFFSPQNTSYAYHDPRSPYSLELADQRAFVRFWSAFTWAIGLLLFLWFFGLLQFGD